jgi:hypothetical protein
VAMPGDQTLRLIPAVASTRLAVASTTGAFGMCLSKGELSSFVPFYTALESIGRRMMKVVPRPASPWAVSVPWCALMRA